MKIVNALLLAGAVALTTASAPAMPVVGVAGILKPDGTFHPFISHQFTGETTGVVLSGLMESTLTITIVTALPAGTTIQCTLSAEVEGASATGLIDSIEETGTVNATVSGSTATCTPKINYEWTLYGSGDQVTLGYEITAISSTGVGRTSSSEIATIAVPHAGATTSYSLKTHI